MNNTTTNLTVSAKDNKFDDSLYWMFNYMFPTIHLCISFLVVLANMLVLSAFIKVQKLRTLTNYFVVNLCAADLTFASAVMLCRLIVLEDKMSPQMTLISCLVKYFLAIGGINVSMFSLLWVAGERYIKLFYPLRYEQILTHKRTVLTIAVTWVISLSSAGIAIAFHRYSHEYVCNACNVFSPIYMWYIFSAIYIPYTLTMFFIYGRIWYLTYQHRKRIATEGTTASKTRVKDIKVTAMFGYIVIMVLSGYGLYIIANIIGYQEDRGRALLYGEPIPAFAGSFVIFEGIVIAIMCFNAGVNPIIYHWKSEAFRKAFKKILGCSNHQDFGDQSVSNTNDSTTKPTTVSGLK